MAVAAGGGQVAGMAAETGEGLHGVVTAWLGRLRIPRRGARL